MQKALKFFLIILLLSSSTKLFGQEYTVLAKDIDTDLVSGRVLAVHEDSDGFIWISTLRGLGRFDGHQIQWFTKSNSGLRDIPSHSIIAEDAAGYLWLKINKRIDLFHHATFEVIPFEEKFKNAFKENSVVEHLSQGENGSVFLKTTRTNEFYHYHPESGLKVLPYLQNMTFIEHHASNEIWAYKRGNEWYKYDLLTGNKLKFFKGGEGYHVRAFSQQEDQFICVGGKEVIVFDAQQNGTQNILQFPLLSMPEKRWNLWHHSMANLWIFNFTIDEKKGLPVWKVANRELTYIKKAPRSKDLDFQRIPIIDSKGIMWATAGKGLKLLKFKSSSFDSYIAFRPIRGIAVKENYLFTLSRRVAFDVPNQIEEIPNLTSMSCVEPNIKDAIWFGGKKGVTKYDFEKDSILERIPLKENIFTRIWTILRDKEGRWWTGTFNDGLLQYIPGQQDSLERYNQYNHLEILKKHDVIHLLEDGKYIWASSNIGLFLIDKETGLKHHYSSKKETPFRLPIDDVHFLHKDKNEIYWVATSTDGLVRFELNEKMEVTNFKKYTEADGLSSSVLYTIIEDEKERLWISTLNGISCFDKKTESIQAFYEEDGITETEFNRASYAKGTDGRIYFGSINGVTGFHPDSVIKKEEYDFPIHITQFSVYKKENQQLIDRTKEVRNTQKIVLQPEDRFFRLNVAMIDYFNAEKLCYSYKIEGLFDEFQNIESNTIEIGGLPYGKYNLRVKGQSADKRFSKQELSIPLIIVRPIYLRWWFILLSLIAIGISAAQIYYWRIQQLNDRKRELEMMVKERTSQIEEQATQLKELNEVKSKFFANISHELRTPLTLILAPLDNLIKKNTHTNREFTHLQLMRQNGQKLLKRINELLDLSRLDSNRLEVFEEATFLYAFLKTMLSVFESTANLKDIRLLFEYDLDENLQILLDKDKTEKIISNYLGNALKFTSKGGTIQLKAEKENRKLKISVQDDGVGILPKELDKIFDRFYQSENNAHLQGTGIGLSLCRELAKILKGRVWAESKIGQGSTFYLELPLTETFALKKEKTSSEISKEAIQEMPKIENKVSEKYLPKILIVEDNPDLRTYLTMILDENYNIETAENGEEALNLLNNQIEKSELPALIISDIMMPVMDGIELLTKIKNAEKLQHLPVVMLTARQSLEVKLEALRIGVDDYLSKPFKEDELKARVSNLVKNSQNRAVISEKTETIQPKAISAADLKWLQEAETIILKNIANSNYKLSDTADEMALSYRRFQQKIKAITGLSPKQYQRSIKLNKARQLLKSGDFRTVTEVMYQMGFEHHHYFSKMYKEEFGIMPSEELLG